MPKKMLCVLSLLGAFASPNVFADWGNENLMTTCQLPQITSDMKCVPEGYKPSFILKFKTALKPEEFQNILARLRLPGVQFSNLTSTSDGNYSLNFRFFRDVGCNRGITVCFRKEEPAILMSYIKSRMPELEDIRLNDDIPYIQPFLGENRLSIPE